MMKHTKHLLVLWAALLLGAGNAWGYTVTFNTATTDGGSTSTNVSDYVDNTSQTYIASITTSKAYYNGKSGVKLGSSSAVGNIVLTLSATGQIKASEISIVSTAFAFDSNKTYKCTVTYTDNNTVSQTQTAGNALTISLDPAKTVSSVKFESVTKSKGRCYIGSFTITPAGSTGTTYKVEPKTTTGGSINVDPTTAAEGAEITIDATPDAGYQFDRWTISPDVEFTGGTSATDAIASFTMPASDVKVSATFIPTATYTVNFYVEGALKQSLTQETAGEAITLPTYAGCGDYTFAGWSTTDNHSNAPEVTGPTYTPTANTNLYAVYSKTTGGGAATWEKTDIGSISASDEVVVTMTAAGTIYALSNNNGTGSAPAATEVTVVNNKITTTITDVLKWNIATSAGSYTLYPNGTTATWLYCTSANNGVRVGTNDNKAFTIDSESGYLKHTATSRYVGVYKADWRCYTSTTGNIEGQTLAFYKKVGGSTTYTTRPGCDCTAPTTKLSITAETTLNLNESSEASTTLSTTGGNGGTVNYAVSLSDGTSTDGATISENTITFNKAGTYTVKATQETYNNKCSQTATIDITVKATPVITLTADEPLTEFAATCMEPSDVQQITVHGFNLENKITATVGGAFQLSTTGGNNDAEWSTSVDFAKDANNRVESPLYIRLKSNIDGCPSEATSTRSGTIKANSTNAAQVQQAVSGKISSPGVTVKLNDQGTNYNIAGKRLCCTIDEDEVKSANNGFSTTPCEGALFSHFTLNPNDLEAKVTFPYSITSTDALTFYAVYKKSEDGGAVGGDYELVTATQDDWSGEYLIAFNSSNFMNGSNATTACEQSTSVSPGSNLSNNTVAATWGDTYAVEFKAVTGGYVLRMQDGTYLYSSGNSNNNQSGTLTDASAKPLTITFNKSTDIDIVYNKSALHWNDNTIASGGQRFRFYKDGKQSKIYLYKKTGSFTYDLTPCGPVIKGTNNIKVTSVNGAWVRSLTDIAITGERLPSNVTIKARVLSGNFKLREPGTRSTGSTEITLATGHTEATYNGTLALLYTPTAAGETSDGEIELKVYTTGGEKVHATCTLTVQGHALPEKFVIAANTGSGWVALPNDKGATLETAGTNTAYPITVDDDGNPTKATLAPSSTVYAGTGRASTYAYSSQSGVRFTYGGKYLEGSLAADTKLCLSPNNSEHAQSWYLESDNFKDYNAYLGARTNANHHLAYDATNKAIANYAAEGTVRFLPIDEECRYFPAPKVTIAQKKTTEVTLTFDALAGATGYQISTDNANWSNATYTVNEGIITLTINGLDANTDYTYYVRGIDSGSMLTNCAESARIDFHTANCDNPPTIGGTITYNSSCGTLTLKATGVSARNNGCPITQYGFQYTQDHTWATYEQAEHIGVPGSEFSNEVTVSRGGKYYVRLYAVNEVGTGSSTPVKEITVSGLANLQIITAGDATTAPIISGKATLRIGAVSDSPSPITWQVFDGSNAEQTTIAAGIANNGVFSTTAFGVYRVVAKQAANADPTYCADSATIYIEVRLPNHYGYVTNCAVLNNNNLEVINVSKDNITFGIDDADVVQIEIVKENTGNTSTGGGGQAKDLFISKYFEATSNVKLIAIYNGTGEDIDLTNYTIKYGKTSWESSYITLKDFGATKGTIAAGEEIILYTYNGSGYDNKILKCVNDSNQTYKPWVRVTSSNNTGGGSLVFAGDKVVALFKGDTPIDVIGAIASTGKPTNTGASVKTPSWGDDNGWTCDEGTSIVDGTTIGLSTNRCLLIRKNTVVSGENAITKNTADFVTLCEEWSGFQIINDETGNVTTNPNYKGILSSCEGFSYVGTFDYAEYFQRYEPVTGKIDLVPLGQNADGSWSLPTSSFKGTAWEGKNFHDLACTSVKINGYQKIGSKDSLITALNYKVPIIVDRTTTTDDADLFGFAGDGRIICPECDVVIRDNKKLSVVPAGYNNIRNMWVYSGAALNIQDDKTYNMGKLTIESENNEVGYALIKGTLNAQDGISHTKRIDANAWYDFSLPYNCKVSDIVRTNGKTLGLYSVNAGDLAKNDTARWVIKYYDGQKRANTGTPNGAAPTNWAVVPADGILEAGVGYIVALGGTHNANPNYKVRFVLPNRSTQPYVESVNDNRTKGVKGYTGPKAEELPCHKGWNYLGNPYVSRFDGNLQDPVWQDAYTGLLLNGFYTDLLTGNSYDVIEYPDLYVAVDMGEGGVTNWVQTKASGAQLSPFRAFMIQAVSDGDVDFNKEARNIPQNDPITPAPSIRSVSAEREIVNAVRLNISHDTYGTGSTDIMLHSLYTDKYDLGYDMVRMFNSRPAAQPFTLNSTADYLLYNAANRDLAETSDIPVGIRTLAAGTYTFSLAPLTGTDRYAAIYLIDRDENDLKIDLLQGNYTTMLARETNTSRFALRFEKGAQLPTDIDNDAIQSPIIYRDQTDIVIDNLPTDATVRVVDAIGRTLYMQQADAQIVRFHAPARGAYIIQVMTQQGNFSIKTIL